MKIEYPYTAEPQEDGSILVQFVDFDEAFTEGLSLEEATFNAAEVLSAIIGYRLDKSETLPDPSAIDGKNILYAAPSPAIQSAVLLQHARSEQKKNLGRSCSRTRDIMAVCCSPGRPKTLADPTAN